MLTILQLGADEAQIAIAAIHTELKRRGKAATIVIADRQGEQLAALRTDGAPLPTLGIAGNKAYTAARHNINTGDFGRNIREGAAALSYFNDPRYIGWQGGVPVRIGHEAIGAIAVSGLSGEEDEELALIGVAAIEQLRT